MALQKLFTQEEPSRVSPPSAAVTDRETEYQVVLDEVLQLRRELNFHPEAVPDAHTLATLKAHRDALKVQVERHHVYEQMPLATGDSQLDGILNKIPDDDRRRDAFAYFMDARKLGLTWGVLRQAAILWTFGNEDAANEIVIEEHIKQRGGN